MSNTEGTTQVGRLTVTSHRGRATDALHSRPELLCFRGGHGHGAAQPGEPNR